MQALVWDVPTSQRSHALDLAIQKFEKSHPNVRVEYENGIPQSEYSNWLSEKLYQERPLMCLWF